MSHPHLASTFEPRWQQCLGHTRCQGCGSSVDTSWRYFTKPATWTHCYCESCVETITQNPA